jgi:hypothetical protein
MKPNDNPESAHSRAGADSEKPVADQPRFHEQLGESSRTKPVDRTDVGGQVASPGSTHPDAVSSSKKRLSAEDLVGVTELIDTNSTERHAVEDIEKRLRSAEIEKARLEGAIEAVRQLKERTGKDLERLNAVIERGFPESVTGGQHSQQESLTEEEPDAARIFEGTRLEDAHSEEAEDEEQPLPPGWYYASDLLPSRKRRWRWRWGARRRGDG